MFSSYIFADLINRAIKFHEKKLNRRGKFPVWMKRPQQVCKHEVRLHKATGREKANAGLLWCEVKQMELTTRQIYFLAICWCLTVNNDEGVEFITDEFLDLCKELEETTLEGIEGKVEDADAKECADEWEYITEIVGIIHKFYMGLQEEVTRA
jgi:hypothetical protein